MKLLVAMVCVFAASICAGCADLLGATREVIVDPEIQKQLGELLARVPEAVASGEWSNLEVGGATVGGTILSGALAKFLANRMKNSPPGAFFGGPPL